MKRLVVTTSLLCSSVYRIIYGYDGKSQRGIILLNDTVQDVDSENLAVKGNLLQRLENVVKEEARDFQAVAGKAVEAVMAMADGGNVGKQILSNRAAANNTVISNRHGIADAFGSLYRSGPEGGTMEGVDECKVETFDVFLVQDTSQTFQSDLNSAVKLMENWIISIQDDYEGSRFGYGTFTDKPIPLSGFGPYGGWQNVKMQYDWCFEMEQSLVDDKDVFVNSLKKVWKKSGSGFDLLESQLEALLRAAMSVDAGWDDERPGIDPNTHVRVIILITDASSHLSGDAADNIAKYNLPVTLVDPVNLITDGGWGSHSFSSTDMINYMKEKSYKKLADLIAKETFGSGVLTEKEEKEMNKQAEYFSPSVYPPVVPHPGDDSLGCAETEYPSAEQVAGVLTGRAIVPVILVINGDAPDKMRCNGQGSKDLKALQACPVMFYQEWMQMYGIRGLVRSFSNDSEHSLAAMIQAVLDSATVICEDPILSTMPPPTRAPSTPSPQDDEEGIATPPEVTTAEAVTSAPEVSTYMEVSTPAIPGASEESSAILTSSTQALEIETSSSSTQVEAMPTEETIPASSASTDAVSHSSSDVDATTSEADANIDETIMTDATREPAASAPVVVDSTASSDEESTAAEQEIVATDKSSQVAPDATPGESDESTPSNEEEPTASSSVQEEIATGEEQIVTPDGERPISDIEETEGEEQIVTPDGEGPISDIEETEGEEEVVSSTTSFTEGTEAEEEQVVSEDGATSIAETQDTQVAISTADGGPLEEEATEADEQAVDETTEALSADLEISTEAHSSFLQKTTPLAVVSTAESGESGKPTESDIYTDIAETPSPIYSDFETTAEGLDDEDVSTSPLEAESTTGATGNKTVVAIASAVGGAGALGAAAMLAHTTGLVGSGGAGASAGTAINAAPEAVANRESVQFVSQDMFA